MAGIPDRIVRPTEYTSSRCGVILDEPSDAAGCLTSTKFTDAFLQQQWPNAVICSRHNTIESRIYDTSIQYMLSTLLVEQHHRTISLLLLFFFDDRCLSWDAANPSLVIEWRIAWLFHSSHTSFSCLSSASTLTYCTKNECHFFRKKVRNIHKRENNRTQLISSISFSSSDFLNPRWAPVVWWYNSAVYILYIACKTTEWEVPVRECDKNHDPEVGDSKIIIRQKKGAQLRDEEQLKPFLWGCSIGPSTCPNLQKKKKKKKKKKKWVRNAPSVTDII
jgi:hypothetical protein